MTDLSRGLEAGHRFRCGGCGNLTRFDIVATTRTRSFHHFDLGGQDVIDSQDVLERTIESVTCRWCGRGDAIEVEPAPL